MARHSVIDARIATFSIETGEWLPHGSLAKRWRCTCGTAGSWWYARDWLDGLEDSFLLEAWQKHFLNKRCRQQTKLKG